MALTKAIIILAYRLCTWKPWKQNTPESHFARKKSKTGRE